MIAQVTSGRRSSSTWLCVTKSAPTFRCDFAGAVRVLLGEADPFHRRMAVRDLAAEQPDAAAADDRDAELFCLRSHVFNPARIFCLNSAICEIVWLVSGRSTGSLRSADRSAAL